MKSPLFGADIISIADLSQSDILTILKLAAHFKKHPNADNLKQKIIATCFFEPSTRTRLSFETAVHRLAGSVIGFDDAQQTSSGQKGESLRDAMRVIGSYADAIVIRHPNAGAARLASEVTNTPVINAGDGGNQHPSQTLLDLFSIQESQGKLKGLNIALVGDLKYGRTVHSLAQALTLFDARLFFVSPEALAMPDSICEYLRSRGIRYSFHKDLHDIIDKVDVLYMTRLQKERFIASEFEQIKHSFILTPELVAQGQKHMKVMHPLPRVQEIHQAVDQMPQAYYFEQAANGVPTRQAMLTLLLQKEIKV